MPPKIKPPTTTTKSIKFGEILIDENKKVLLLCSNCFLNFMSVNEFVKHLKDCKLAKHIFETSNPDLKLECEKLTLLRKVKQTSKELLIYGVKEKSTASSIRDIEAEILDPRWYTDAAASSPIRTLNKTNETYDNLIEEVTPFVQFKENVRLLSTPRQSAASNKQIKIQSSKANIPKPQPHTVETIARNKNSTTNTQIKQQQIIRNSLTAQNKPICVKNFPNASPPSINARQPILKRKSTTLESSAVTATANAQLVAPIAVKRMRPSAESSTPIQQKPMPRDIRVQPKTLTTLNKQPALPKICIKTTPPKPIQTNIQNQPTKPVQRVLPKTLVVSKPDLVPTATSSTATTAVTNKRTVDILNKLQTLGLKVERTNPAPSAVPIAKKQNSAALEIIKKLQLKGMEVKRVPKTSPIVNPKPPSLPSQTSTVKYINTNAIQSSRAMVNTQRRNLFIRKNN